MEINNGNTKRSSHLANASVRCDGILEAENCTVYIRIPIPYVGIVRCTFICLKSERNRISIVVREEDTADTPTGYFDMI